MGLKEHSKAVNRKGIRPFFFQWQRQTVKWIICLKVRSLGQLSVRVHLRVKDLSSNGPAWNSLWQCALDGLATPQWHAALVEVY